MEVERDAWRRGRSRAGCAGSAQVVAEVGAGHTRLTKLCARSPLRLLCPRNDGSAAWVFTSSFGGGLVHGDVLSFELEVRPGAELLVTTQASTKVYGRRGPPPGEPGTRGAEDDACRSELFAEVGEGGVLYWLPDPTVCFAGAQYEQQSEIVLGRDASLVYLDMLSAGRIARGERWDFASYGSRLTVRGEHGPALVRERLLLDPQHGDLRDRLGGLGALASVVIAGPRFAEATEQLLAQVGRRPVRAADRVHLSASPLGMRGHGEHTPTHLTTQPSTHLTTQPSTQKGPVGVVVRCLGGSPHEVTEALRELLTFVPKALGDDPSAYKP